MKHIGLKIAGATAGFLLIGSAYGHIRRKRQDNIAAELIHQLNKIIKPTTDGLSGEDAFNIHFMDRVLEKVKGNIWTIKKSTANRYAERIHQAWKPWYQGGDDEVKVYAVFRELGDKVHVSQVAKAYKSNYGEDLIDKLNEKLDKKEVKKILKMVAPLPSYRKI